MNESNYEKYKSRKSEPNVKVIEEAMNTNFYNTAKAFNL
jgi:hypothetical protein